MQGLYMAALNKVLYIYILWRNKKNTNTFWMTLSAQQTKTDTCTNSVDLDETAQNEPSHQDLHCLPFCFFYFRLYLNPCLHQWTCPTSRMGQSTSESKGWRVKKRASSRTMFKLDIKIIFLKRQNSNNKYVQTNPLQGSSKICLYVGICWNVGDVFIASQIKDTW